MDPLTHGLVGAMASQAFFARRLGRLAPLVGAAAGVLAELDFFIGTPRNPMAGLTLHHQFTHALLFVPVGGLLAMLPFFWLKSLRYRRRSLVGASMLAYALHPLLDVCSSAGTCVFWPLSEHRFAMDWISVFDPLLILILLGAIIPGLVKINPGPARIGLMAAMLYLGVGAAQHERAIATQKQLAQSRRHEFTNNRVLPTVGNLVIWRSLYSYNSRVYVDALRLPPGGEAGYRQGENVPEYAQKKLSKVFQGSPQLRDIQRFGELADHWLAWMPQSPGAGLSLADMRYSYTPEGIVPLQGIELDIDQPQSPLKMIHPPAPRSGLYSDLWNDIFQARSNGRSFQPLPAVPREE